MSIEQILCSYKNMNSYFWFLADKNSGDYSLEIDEEDDQLIKGLNILKIETISISMLNKPLQMLVITDFTQAMNSERNRIRKNF